MKNEAREGFEAFVHRAIQSGKKMVTEEVGKEEWWCQVVDGQHFAGIGNRAWKVCETGDSFSLEEIEGGRHDCVNPVEIIWESEDRNFDGVPWVTVKRCDGWFHYMERAGKDSIAFILKGEDNRYGLIRELKPPLKTEAGVDVFLTTAFGGSIDGGNRTHEEILLEEVREESGYEVGVDDVVYAGKTMVSTQMNQLCHLYLVDVRGKNAGKTEMDFARENGDFEFSRNEIVWMTKEEVIQNSDWKSIFILARTGEIC